MSTYLRLSLALLFTATAATACAVKTEKSADTSAVGDTTSAVVTPSDTTPMPVPPPPAPGPSGKSPSPDMTVTEYGIGPIKAGMTVQQANAAIGGGFAAPKGGASGCTYAVLTKATPGLAVMLENGKVARVEVREGSIATSTGARIGDTEARIKSLYPGVITTNHKYTPTWHYLTVTGSDPANRIVFESNGSTVANYRSGRTPAVEYTERCG